MILVLIKTCVQHVKACNVAKGICAKQTDNHEIYHHQQHLLQSSIVFLEKESTV